MRVASIKALSLTNRSASRQTNDAIYRTLPTAEFLHAELLADIVGNLTSGSFLFCVTWTPRFVLRLSQPQM